MRHIYYFFLLLIPFNTQASDTTQINFIWLVSANTSFSQPEIINGGTYLSPNSSIGFGKSTGLSIQYKNFGTTFSIGKQQISSGIKINSTNINSGLSPSSILQSNISDNYYQWGLSYQLHLSKTLRFIVTPSVIFSKNSKTQPGPQAQYFNNDGSIYYQETGNISVPASKDLQISSAFDIKMGKYFFLSFAYLYRYSGKEILNSNFIINDSQPEYRLEGSYTQKASYHALEISLKTNLSQVFRTLNNKKQ